MSELPSRTDVLIIGGGPSGSAAASILEQRGVSTCIVEKKHFPRFVIGESLLPRCMDLLQEAGLLEAVDARGYLRKDGATFWRGSARRDFVFAEQFTDGWGHTYQVPRADFDQALLDGACAHGANVQHGVEVVDARLGASPSVRLKGPSGEAHTIDARFIIDASGYGRVLPRLLGLDRPSHLPVRHSLFTWVASDRREAGARGGRTWVCVHPGGAWIWVIPFSDGRTSVGAVATPDFFEAYPEDPSERLRSILDGEPNVRARLGDAEFVFEPKLIGGYSVGVERLHGEGFCLVGNTMEFLDPVFSSGVTLALESSVRAAHLVARQLGGEAIDWDAEYSDHVASGVSAFRTYVDAWYDGTLQKLMFAESIPMPVQQQVTSVLAGYVWDASNPFVTDGARRLSTLARAVDAGMGS